jgi:dTMP kinase
LKPGLFITLEGIDGSGKSTQLRLLVKYLRHQGHKVCCTREPGGTALGEEIRRLLLSFGKSGPRRNRPRAPSEMMSPLAELALVYAARAQHLAEVVRPALARGEVVVSDRFNHASLAYQGYGRKLGVETVRAFDRVVCGPTQPDLTIVLDVSPRIALARALHRDSRRHSGGNRFEDEGLAFQHRVRAGYLEIARQEPQRVKLLRADRALTEVHAEIRALVDTLPTPRKTNLKARTTR